MTNVYAFVDSIGASPTVLLNLDDQNPLSVEEGMKTAPPTRRTSSYGSSARDGDVIAQESYNDRSITIPLSFKQGSTAEQQATTIQALGRLLDGPQWLKWQHDGATAPVFFRTRYGDIDIDDQIGTPTPTRYATLTLVAEPFGYGLQESGNATIANDPTTGTNRMTYTMPTIKGDVATPLWLYGHQNATNGPWISLFSVSSVAIGSPLGVPLAAAAATPGAAPAGWAYSTSADSTAVSGTQTRATRSSGVLSAGFASVPIASAPPGDYRVLARMKSSSFSATVQVAPPSDPTTFNSAKNIPGLTWAWVDLGVVRAPGLTLRGTSLLDQGYTSPTTISLQVGFTTGNGTIDLDEVLLIPVGQDKAADASTVLTYVGSSGSDLLLDGVNEQACLVAAGVVQPSMVTLAGGFPRVTPGFDNHLNFVRRINYAGDDKTVTTTVDFIYFPKYLYVRPATT